MMLYWDVNNGITRRSWAGNIGSQSTIKKELAKTSKLKVTLPYSTDEELIDKIFK